MNPRGNLRVSSLGLAMMWIGSGFVAFTALLVAFDWENGYSQLAFVLTAISAMGFVITRNSYIHGDALQLSSTIPLAWLFFLLPNSILLVNEFRGTYVYYFRVLTHTLAIYSSDATYALGIIALGAVCYAAGVACGGSKRESSLEMQLDGELLHARAFRRHGVLPLAAMLLTCYLGALYWLAGGAAQMLVLVTDPVAREEVQSTSLTALLVCLFFGFLTCVAILFASRLAHGASAYHPLSILLFALAAAMALPLASRGYVLSVLLYPILIYHYLRRRISLSAILIASLALPLVATLLRLLRVGGGEFDSVAGFGAFTAFWSESNMVSMLSAAVGAIQSGRIDYASGVDFGLFFLWFVPRALWPGKPLPLDYRLTLQLGIADNGRAYGSPVTLFGGLFLNLTIAGMAAAVFLIGLLVARRDLRLPMSQARPLLWRVMLFAFLVDLTRVGDVSRELTVLLMQWLMFAFVSAALGIPKSSETIPAAKNPTDYRAVA